MTAGKLVDIGLANEAEFLFTITEENKSIILKDCTRTIGMEVPKTQVKS